jgi:hypothetical protein
MLRIAMLAGPALGGSLAEYKFALCFAISSLCGLVSMALFGIGMSETRDNAAASKHSAGASLPHPVSFVKLFRTKTMAKLTLAMGISEMCDGTTEIDRYYAQDVAGLTLTQNGMVAFSAPRHMVGMTIKSHVSRNGPVLNIKFSLQACIRAAVVLQ